MRSMRQHGAGGLTLASVFLTLTVAVVPPTMAASRTDCGPVPSPSPGSYTNTLSGVASVTPDDIWAVGWTADWTSPHRTLIEHWDGTAWSVEPSPNPGEGSNLLRGVAATSASDVWAVGEFSSGPGATSTLIEHWDGAAWSVIPSPNPPDASSSYLVDVTATPAGDLWAVGYYRDFSSIHRTLIEHWDGTAWSIVSSPGQGSLSDVAALSPTDVWAVGGDGGDGTLVERWDGSTWTVVPSPSRGASSSLAGVAAVSSGDVWAVGWYERQDQTSKTLIEHWDGSSWVGVPSPNRGPEANVLAAVAAVDSDDVWAVGDYGVHHLLAEHWDGSTWAGVRTPNPGPIDHRFFGVTVASSGEVWAVGMGQANEGRIRTLVQVLCL
jgi:hypothetical protein